MTINTDDLAVGEILLALHGLARYEQDCIGLEELPLGDASEDWFFTLKDLIRDTIHHATQDEDGMFLLHLTGLLPPNLEHSLQRLAEHLPTFEFEALQKVVQILLALSRDEPSALPGAEHA